jgi:hypothetical protein
MELRRAQNPALTKWGQPRASRNSSFLPTRSISGRFPTTLFDHGRYPSWSTDGCNSTTKQVPCAAGGQLELLVSKALHGPEAE